MSVLRINLDASLPGDPLSSLIRVADTSAEASDWPRGATVRAWPVVDVDLFGDRCDGASRDRTAGPASGSIDDVDPMLATLAFECTTFSARGAGIGDVRARVQRAFESVEHLAVEREFELGELYPDNPNLRDVPIIGGGALGVAEAIGLLDAHVPGRGTLHMTPLLAAFGFAAGVLDRDGQGRAITRAKGSLVAVGDGYTGLGPVGWRTARLTTAMTGPNNDLTLVGRGPGTAGNGITFAIVDPPGNNVALSVGVAGSAITVTAATDGTSTITSTAAQVLAALQASAPAMALVSAALKAGDTGAGLVTALGATNLAGGLDATPTGDEYAYVTGPVRVIRDPQVVTEPDDQTAVDVAINNVTLYAERNYLIFADLSRAAAALVDRTTLYS